MTEPARTDLANLPQLPLSADQMACLLELKQTINDEFNRVGRELGDAFEETPLDDMLGHLITVIEKQMANSIPLDWRAADTQLCALLEIADLGSAWNDGRDIRMVRNIQAGLRHFSENVEIPEAGEADQDDV